MATGIETRHQSTCRSSSGGRCNCEPSYRAQVWSARDNRTIRKSFPTKAAAKAWRQDAQSALRAGSMRAPTAQTVREAAAVWHEGARNGCIRNRSGDLYKPSTIRSYDQNLRRRILSPLGAHRLSDLHRSDLQRFVERLVGEGHAASTIHGSIAALHVIYRREVAHGRLAVDPTQGLSLPAIRNGRYRFADPQEAAALLEALPVDDQALWATAIYAGLRRGELMALDWSSVDLASGVIHVERSWDDKEGYIAPKSAKGRRKVPIAAGLRSFLLEHRMRHGRAEGLAFGRTVSRPFAPYVPQKRADKAWQAAGLTRLTLHDCRHTFASLMIAAGVNAKALSTFMGHANITVTLDRYGHLFRGSEEEAADLLDAYLDRANRQAILAAVGTVSGQSTPVS